MGCHTWFHKKLETPTAKQARNELIQFYYKWLPYVENCISNHNPENMLELKDYILWKTIILRNLKNMRYWSHKYLLQMYVEETIDEGHYVPDKGIYTWENIEYHDIFRIGNYPKNCLFSFEETIDFIESNSEKIYYYETKEKAIERLKQYWSEYPNGMISFG